MVELVLRDYQEDLVNRIEAAWTRSRSVIAWLPTGGGKTEIAVHLAMREKTRRGCTLFVVDRKTLAGQARNRYGAKYGMLTGLLRGEATFVRGYEPVLVASIQTLRARWDREEILQALERVTLLVVDEAHIRFKHHEAVMEHLPNARVLGLTATPLRDGLALLYGELVRGPSYGELTERGYLVPARYFVPHLDDVKAALGGVSVASTGDFVSRQLSELMRRKTIVGDVVSTWRARAADRPTIAFCVDRAHSKEVCDAFVAEGIASEHIDLHTPEEERLAMFARFRRGETRVLCSIVVLGVGFDEPCASCAILARPTLSLSMHVQQIGRVLRTSPGKSDAMILDHAGNVLRHGRVEDFVPPELSEIDKRTDKVARNHATDYRPCPECRAVIGPGQRVCPECGHELTRKNVVDFIPGRLLEPTQDREGLSRVELQRLYRELRHIARARGYKVGWAFVKLRERFGFKAPFDWRYLEPTPPSAATNRLVLSWQIADRKRREKERQIGADVTT